MLFMLICFFNNSINEKENVDWNYILFNWVIIFIIKLVFVNR